jgi:hypothetical protein
VRAACRAARCRPRGALRGSGNRRARKRVDSGATPVDDQQVKAVVVFAALGFAVAPGPYPAQHQGGGSEPTAGRGVFAGTPFVPRSALVDYELGASCCPQSTVGQVNVFLFEAPKVTCGTLEAAKAKRFFSYTVETDGKKVPVGERPPVKWFQQWSFNVVGLTTGTQFGSTALFTRVDTSRNGMWHGRISVARQKLSGKVYSLSATFAARWCGSKRS